jgi:hypothetical protein
MQFSLIIMICLYLVYAYSMPTTPPRPYYRCSGKAIVRRLMKIKLPIFTSDIPFHVLHWRSPRFEAPREMARREDPIVSHGTVMQGEGCREASHGLSAMIRYEQASSMDASGCVTC